MYQLLYTDASYAAALAVNVRHVMATCESIRLRLMDGVFDLYEHMAPGQWRSELSPRYFGSGPRKSTALRTTACNSNSVGPEEGPIDSGTPIVFRMRAHNTSPEPWQLKAGSEAGVYAWYIVQDTGWRF